MKYAWYVRLVFWFQKRKYGSVLNSAKVWGRLPRVFMALSWLYKSLDRKGALIGEGMRVMIIVRVSQINGCEFCIDLNTTRWLGIVGKEKVLGLVNWRESEEFDERERVVLEYLEVMTGSKGEVDEELRIRIREYFSEEEVIEITALIAFQNMSTKFNNGMGVEEQGFFKE